MAEILKTNKNEGRSIRHLFEESYNLIMARKVLLVDDTRNVQLMLSEFLENQDFKVLLAFDGLEAWQIYQQEKPDLILLDIMMPNMDGYQFISKLRAESDLPVIMISARQQEADIIRGFELGADDYITKPFHLRELLMRIRAVMRRAALSDTASGKLIVQDLLLDKTDHRVLQANHPLDLTPLEFKLLEILMQSAGKVVKRQDASLKLMDHGFTGSESTLKIHIRNLRNKLGEDIDQPRYIETVFGIGYRFMEGEK